MNVLPFLFRLQRTGIHPILIILMAVAGVILLLPGVCAAGFMVLGGLRRNRLIRRHDDDRPTLCSTDPWATAHLNRDRHF